MSTAAELYRRQIQKEADARRKKLKENPTGQDLLAQADELLRRSGLMSEMESFRNEGWQYHPLEAKQKGRVIGRHVLMRGRFGGTADPYYYYKGEEVLIEAMPGSRLIRIFSQEPVVEVQSGPRGGFTREIKNFLK